MPDSPQSSDSGAFTPDAMQVMRDEMLPAGDVSRFSAVLGQEEFRTELNRLFLTEALGKAASQDCLSSSSASLQW